MTNEKSQIAHNDQDDVPSPVVGTTRPSVRTFILLWLGCYLLAFRQPLARAWTSPFSGNDVLPISHGSQCHQVAPLLPKHSSPLLEKMEAYLDSETFRNGTIERMSKAVQIATQSYDDLGKIGEDKRWDVMYDFAAHLEERFPNVYANLKLEKVNTHGLLYTWAGTDADAKPTLLMAHQDVVPVPDATVDAWTHPPFSGFYDGKFIWGRGASDCKNQLIAILEAVESLLIAEYVPQRTVLISFGFDEEVSGPQGAGHLAPFLFERYGKDSIAAIVDEGATFEKAWGRVMAKPGVAEKGYTDVTITVRMPGGHSSIPSDHTSIGVASEIITAIESEQYPLRLSKDNPYLAQLYCGAEYAPDFPKKLKKILAHSQSQCPASKKHDRLAEEAAKAGPQVKYLMQTSQAVDVISGGVKVNALPERTVVIVNHRLNLGEQLQEIWDHLESIIKPIAKKHNLGLHAFDGTEEAPSSISLSTGNHSLPTAPISPTAVDTVTPYSILAATTRAMYGEDIIVTPGIMTGNTDTRYYWDLTQHIFRFGPGYDPEGDPGLGRIHTVDERVSVVGHINTVKWFVLFLRNMDEAKL